MAAPLDKGQDASARKGRQIAVLIAATGLIWIGAQFLGMALGISHRWLALVDLMALAGFVMALVMTFQIWRARQGN
jgi:hypothetical protein